MNEYVFSRSNIESHHITSSPETPEWMKKDRDDGNSLKITLNALDKY